MKRIAGERDEVSGFEKEYLPRIASYGFTKCPNVLLRYGRKLGLKSSDLAFILHILSYKIDGSESFPGMLKISAESGISRRTLHRSKKELEEKGYLEVTKLYGHRSYVYNLNGLWKRVRELIDIDKERLYQTRKLKKEKYEEYKNYSSLEDSHLVERQNGTD